MINNYLILIYILELLNIPICFVSKIMLQKKRKVLMIIIENNTLE